MTFMTLFLLVLAAIVGVALVAGIRIVPQAKVLVVERLGRFHHVAHSGLNILLPFPTPRGRSNCAVPGADCCARAPWTCVSR
jgi:regulator of protease activity HflC (stomatin/prohibitin superfamily)